MLSTNFFILFCFCVVKIGELQEQPIYLKQIIVSHIVFLCCFLFFCTRQQWRAENKTDSLGQNSKITSNISSFFFVLVFFFPKQNFLFCHFKHWASIQYVMKTFRETLLRRRRSMEQVAHNNVAHAGPCPAARSGCQRWEKYSARSNTPKQAGTSFTKLHYTYRMYNTT